MPPIDLTPPGQRATIADLDRYAARVASDEREMAAALIAAQGHAVLWTSAAGRRIHLDLASWDAHVATRVATSRLRA